MCPDSALSFCSGTPPWQCSGTLFRHSALHDSLHWHYTLALPWHSALASTSERCSSIVMQMSLQMACCFISPAVEESVAAGPAYIAACIIIYGYFGRQVRRFRGAPLPLQSLLTRHGNICVLSCYDLWSQSEVHFSQMTFGRSDLRLYMVTALGRRSHFSFTNSTQSLGH